MSFNPHDHIAAYCSGKLPAPDRSAFERTLEQDPELAAEVQAHRRMLAALSGHRGALRNRLEKISAAKSVAEPAVRDHVPFWRYGWFWLFLLGFTALLCWFIFRPQAEAKIPVPGETNAVEFPTETPAAPMLETTPTIVAPDGETEKDQRDKPTSEPLVERTPPESTTKPTNKQLALALYQGYDPVVFKSEDTEVSADSLSLARTAYLAKNWREVLNIAPRTGEEALKLRGHAAFRSGGYDLAVAYFKALERVDPFYAEAAQWYQLLSLAAAGRDGEERFRVLLQEIDTPGHRYRGKAAF